MKHGLFLTYILFVTFCIVAGCAQEPTPGGFAKASVTEEDVVAATAFAIKTQEKTMQDPKGGQPTKLELVRILGAEEQVVAGVNYQLKLKVKVNGKEKRAEAVVWWQAWREPDPYQLTSWKWSDQ